MYCISHPSPHQQYLPPLGVFLFPCQNLSCVNQSAPVLLGRMNDIQYMYRVYCILVSFSRNSLILPSRADEQELRKETRWPKHLMREYGRHVARGFADFSQNPRK